MSFARDLRFAWRRLTTSKGFFAAAVVTLALAIGATTAIFSAVYAVLLKPMPIREPGSLVVAWGAGESLAQHVVELSYLDVQDLGEQNPRIGAVASVGSSAWSDVLESEGEPVRLTSYGVSGNFFDLLGAVPQLGRVIRADDDRTNSPGVVVISHGVWVRQFGSDPAIIGRRAIFDGQPNEIVGVMPAAFDYPRGTQLWRAIAPVLGDGTGGGNPNPLRNVGLLFMIARLNPGITIATANDAWSQTEARLRQTLGGPTYNIVGTPFLDHHVGPARQALWILLAAVGVLLLIACANVSGLMLTRVSLRHHDDAVRLAIGGSRSAISRVWAAETVWLVLIGGAAGLLTCQWFIRAIVALAPDGIPRLDEIAIDRPIFLFTMSVMAVATLLCGIAPIRHASIVNLTETLNDGSRTIAGGRSYRTRSTLLVLQIAMAVVLLVAAGLVVRSFDALRALNLGFDREAVLRMNIQPRGVARERVNDWMAQLLPQIEAMPGVEAAGAVYLTPMELGSIGQGTWTVAEGQPETPETAKANPVLNYLSATPSYFSAMRIPLKQGRMFNDGDRGSGQRVAIVSESTAAALFPGQNPIGKRIKAAGFDSKRDPQGAWRTIVGVVGNVRYRGLKEVQLELYDPPMQTLTPTTSVVVRLAGNSARNAIGLASAIQSRARELDPQVLVSNITTLDQVVDKEMAPWRFSAWVFAVFAGLAFSLSMLGLFSLVSLDVANRRKEFAIRMAVGATPQHIVGNAFKAASRRSAYGIAGGLVVAFAATQGLQGLLFGVTLRDRVTYVAVTTLVLAVVLVASYVPARRAGSTDPLALLRRD